MPKQATDSGAEKWGAIEKLKTEEGRRGFMGKFEERLAGYERLIKNGGDFLVEKEAGDMQATADQIREQEPEVATFIDQAREKIEALLRKARIDELWTD